MKYNHGVIFLFPSNFRTVQSFEKDFHHAIDGGGSEIDTKTLSGGALINRIFHERLPYEMNKVKCSIIYFLKYVQHSISIIFMTELTNRIIFSPQM